MGKGESSWVRKKVDASLRRFPKSSHGELYVEKRRRKRRSGFEEQGVCGKGLGMMTEACGSG